MRKDLHQHALDAVSGLQHESVSNHHGCHALHVDWRDECGPIHQSSNSVRNVCERCDKRRMSGGDKPGCCLESSVGLGGEAIAEGRVVAELDDELAEVEHDVAAGKDVWELAAHHCKALERHGVE